MTAITFIVQIAFLGACATVVAFRHDATPLSPPPNSTLDYLERTLKGLDRAFAFFRHVYQDVNLDAVIGTRIVEASFNVLLQRLVGKGVISKVPGSVISQIKHIRDEAKRVSDLATPYVIQNQPQYYANIGPILTEGLFELDYDSRDISQASPVWVHGSGESITEGESMTEGDSDTCVKELCGTSNGRTCAISNGCWKRMTALGYHRYSLSHEIFYLEIAERFGCQLEMSWQISANRQGSLRRLHDVFCANMLVEATQIAAGGFPEESRDLFMEQAALCGMLGYRDFFSSSWLDSILSWQDKNDGCYKWDGWQPADGNILPQLSTDHKEAAHRMIKREEKRVASGCLCHKTTVAVSALSQYVRYILEVWLQEQM